MATGNPAISMRSSVTEGLGVGAPGTLARSRRAPVEDSDELGPERARGHAVEPGRDLDDVGRHGEGARAHDADDLEAGGGGGAEEVVDVAELTHARIRDPAEAAQAQR